MRPQTPNNYTDCGNGCFNMGGDSYHCGSCTHSCKGDICKSSACQVTQGGSGDVLCTLRNYRIVAEGGADGVAADGTYVYGLFNDGNQNKPTLFRCRANGRGVAEIIFPGAGMSPAASFGAFGGIRDTGAPYSGALGKRRTSRSMSTDSSARRCTRQLLSRTQQLLPRAKTMTTG